MSDRGWRTGKVLSEEEQAALDILQRVLSRRDAKYDPEALKRPLRRGQEGRFFRGGQAVRQLKAERTACSEHKLRQRISKVAKGSGRRTARNEPSQDAAGRAGPGRERTGPGRHRSKRGSRDAAGAGGGSARVSFVLRRSPEPRAPLGSGGGGSRRAFSAPRLLPEPRAPGTFPARLGARLLHSPGAGPGRARRAGHSPRPAAGACLSVCLPVPGPPGPAGAAGGGAGARLERARLRGPGAEQGPLGFLLLHRIQQS